MADVKKSIIPKARDNTDKNIVDLDSVGLGHLKKKLTDIDLSNYDSTDSSDVVLKDITTSSKDLNRLRKLVKKYNESPLSLIRKISADEIRIGKTIDFSKGGTPMMKRQMELFEDGGLKEEGGMIEPESGNVVPSGSSREEVADDIPAMLSEGEFVFPADVTRYIGLDKLMSLRQDAKMGLAKMEAMGQMGEERDASKDEELPFGIADLIVVSESGEPLEMAEGGVASTRSLDTSAVPTRSNRRTSFKEIMGQNRIIFKEYKNAAGKSMTIAFLGNVPLYPIPDGYTYYDPNNPDSHPSTGIGGTAPVTEPNILVKETPEYGGELDSLGRPVGSVHTPPNYSAMNNAEFTSAMTTKHTKGLNTDKIALSLISIVAPPIGTVATIAHYKDVQLDIARMEARKSQGSLTTEQTKALDAAIAIAKDKIGSAFAKGVLTITDSIAKALGLNPQQIEQYKNNATQATNAAVNTETNNNENVNTFVSNATKQLTFKDQAKIAPSFTKTTDKVVSGTPGVDKPGEINPYGTTPQQVAPPILENKLPFGLLANQQMITDQSFTPASPSNVADSIIQKSMPTAEFNPVTGQLETKLPFTPVAPPTFDQLVSNKAAVGRPIDRIDPTLGMPLDPVPMIDTSNIKNINPTLGMPMEPSMTPSGGIGFIPDNTTPSLAPSIEVKTDDYGNAFPPQAQLDMFNLGYGQQTGMPGMTGFGGGYQPASQPSTAPAAGVGYDIGITAPASTSPVAAGQGFDIGVEAPQTALGIDTPAIVSYGSGEIAAPFGYYQQQIKDIPGAADFDTSSNIPAELQEPVGDPAAARAKENQTMVDAYKDYNPYGTTPAPAQTIGDLESQYSTSPSNVPTAQQLSNQQMSTNQIMGLTPTAPAAGVGYDIGIGDTGITSSPTLTEDFRFLEAPVKTVPVKAPVVKKYDTSSLVSGAYTGSGMGGVISEGGNIAGVTGPEGVVPDVNNPGYVSKVEKTLSNGNVTEHTVFSNSLGQLYAKNPFGSTFTVTKNKDNTFTAGEKTPKDFLTDAQPKSILSGLFSSTTTSTPTTSEGEAPATSTSGNVSTGGVTSGVGTGTSVGLADEGSDGGDGPDGKIVCTEMYRQTNLDDWAKAMKMWDVYQRKYLTPIHEVGYHWLFKPYVRGMKKSTILTSLGSLLAEKRTQHIKHILTKGKAKDNLIGKIWCSIIHPIVYTAGKIKLYTEKRY